MRPLNIRPPRYHIRVGAQRFPFLRTVELADATAPLADYVEEAATGGPIVITRRGRPVAFLARVKGRDLESLSMGTDPSFLDLLEVSRRPVSRPRPGQPGRERTRPRSRRRPKP